MATISSPGIGSGLDINGLVSKLMAAEQQPLTDIDKKEAGLQAKLSAYGSLKGALSSFQSTVAALASPFTFNAMKGTVADSSVASISTATTAKAASYRLDVTTLAQAQKLTSAETARIADPTAAIGNGTMTIDFGTYDGASFNVNADKTSKTITIDDTNNSLNGIRDAINAADAGVTASIINDGQGYRLVLSSNDSGANNSMRITVSEGGAPSGDLDMTGLSQFAYDPTKTAYDAGVPGSGGKNLGQSVEAKSAAFKLDGISMTSSSNTVSNAIQGVTLTLSKEASTTTVTVARDPAGVKSAINNFVKAYNDLAKTMSDLGKYDAKTKKAGTLQGDAGLRSIQEQVRRLISQQVSGLSSSDVSSLSNIGVSFQRDGTLAVNSTKLDQVLADSTKNVGALFSSMGIASDSLVSYIGATSATKAGTYYVDVSQVSSQGAASGAAPAVTNITDSNKSLAFLIDGKVVSIDLRVANYASVDDLAAEMQSKINSDATLLSLGKKVTVSHDGAGKLTVTSNLYGAASSVDVTGGSGATDLFGAATITGTPGHDVAGTVGGTPATGSGQILTGSGDAEGLQILVNGGVTGGRGTMTFTRGVAYQLNQTIQSMLDSDGTFAAYTNGIDRSIKDLDKQRDVLSQRLVNIEKRYRAQFNALDTTIAQMQQTSSYLTQQLSALSAQSK